MRVEQEMVAAFMRKNAFTVGKDLAETCKSQSGTPGEEELAHAVWAAEMLVQRLKAAAKSNPADERTSRAYLMLEELVETMDAMLSSDEVELADGLADLAYTVLGTAVTFNIPLQPIFLEVHRSNMTKQRKGDDHLIKADKGGAYSPPDVEAVLDRARDEAVA